jgi:hypothetical protein
VTAFRIYGMITTPLTGAVYLLALNEFRAQKVLQLGPNPTSPMEQPWGMVRM